MPKSSLKHFEQFDQTRQIFFDLKAYLLKTYFAQQKQLKYTPAILSCSRDLTRVIYKLRLNAWNTKYPQNVKWIPMNALSVNYILLECPNTTELFQNKTVMTLMFVIM